MVLPHMGEQPLGTYCDKKAISWSAASSSVSVEAFTLSIKPLRPCVPLFQVSMASSTLSGWWITSTGPSTRGVKSGPVTTTAISIRRSFSGSSPVISQSSQTRFWSDLASAGAASGVQTASVMAPDCPRPAAGQAAARPCAPPRRPKLRSFAA